MVMLIQLKFMIILLFIFLTFDFCRFCLVISSPPQRLMMSDFEGFSIPDFIHNIYFPILILDENSNIKAIYR